MGNAVRLVSGEPAAEEMEGREEGPECGCDCGWSLEVPYHEALLMVPLLAPGKLSGELDLFLIISTLSQLSGVLTGDAAKEPPRIRGLRLTERER